MITKGQCHEQFEAFLKDSGFSADKKAFFDGVRRHFEEWCKDKVSGGLFGPDMVFDFPQYVYTIIYVGYALKEEHLQDDLVKTQGRLTTFREKLMEESKMTWAHWLDWRTNDPHRLTKMFVQEVEDERIQDTIPLIRHLVTKQLDPKKNKGQFEKAVNTLLKMAGRDKGQPPPPRGLQVTAVMGYAEKEDERDAIQQTSVSNSGEKVLSDGMGAEPKTA